MTVEDIERDPSLATEANLTLLLESLIEVHASEGIDLGGHDCNLESYYESRYSVARNTAAFEVIKAIARYNLAAFSKRIWELLEEIAKCRVDWSVTTSTLHRGTSYLNDPGNLESAEQERARILMEIKGLFGKGLRK